LSYQLSYATSSLVSTETGDHLLRVYIPGSIQATEANSAWPFLCV